MVVAAQQRFRRPRPDLTRRWGVTRTSPWSVRRGRAAGADNNRRLIHAHRFHAEIRIDLQLMPQTVLALLPWRHERHLHLELAAWRYRARNRQPELDSLVNPLEVTGSDEHHVQENLGRLRSVPGALAHV